MIRIIVLCIFLLAGSAFPQPTAGPTLLDEFERTPCDEFKARLDFLNINLSGHPTSTVYIVIFGEQDDMRANVFYEGMIVGYLRQRQLDPDRVRFIHSSYKKKLTFQMWLVPSGVEKPSFPTVDWSYKMPPTMKAYKFTWLNEYDDICPDVDGVGLYSQFLEANPQARGNIVIRDVTDKARRRLSRSTLTELSRRYGISRNRLRVFYANEMPDGVDQRVEYWLVP